jgi:hypothetical protein
MQPGQLCTKLIKKEVLAVVFGCTQFHDYIYGLKEIQVETA